MMMTRRKTHMRARDKVLGMPRPVDRVRGPVVGRLDAREVGDRVHIVGVAAVARVDGHAAGRRGPAARRGRRDVARQGRGDDEDRDRLDSHHRG